MLYLYPKKLDLELPKDNIAVILNETSAKQLGVQQGDLIIVHLRDNEIGAFVMVTDTEIDSAHIGIPANIWQKYPVSELEFISIEPFSQSKSVEYIRKKYKGGVLNYEEAFTLMNDIVHFKLTTIELTYFSAIGFTIGFTPQELYYLTKAMVETGTKFNFKGLGKPVVDKHSIGGMAGKGITPVLIPILASMGFLVPNTFSRAITSPAGTADVLETVMPVALNDKQIYDTIYKENACLVWGGALDLAPADDILIQVEKPLHIESYDKFIISILAKKIAMGVEYLLIDIPYGPYGKIDEHTLPLVKRGFKTLAEKFGIKLIAYDRPAYGVDGKGVGPILEMRDTLLVLERKEKRPLSIENVVLDMAGNLAKLVGIVKTKEEGIIKARKILDSGQALEKFWSIAFAQGAKNYVTSEMLNPGIFNYQVISNKSGTIQYFDNQKIVKLARALGAPQDKGAGIYLEKFIGEDIKKGDLIATLYADTKDRLDLAIKKLDDIGDFIIYKN